MPTSMPLLLVAAFIALFGCLGTLQRQAKNFRGSSRAYFLAINYSAVAGIVVAVGLLVFYGYTTHWYWPMILFVIGSIAAGIVFGLLEATVAPLVLSVGSFLLWPVAAIVVYLVVSGLGR
jgi:hypothetical protein